VVAFALEGHRDMGDLGEDTAVATEHHLELIEAGIFLDINEVGPDPPRREAAELRHAGTTLAGLLAESAHCLLDIGENPRYRTTDDGFYDAADIRIAADDPFPVAGRSARRI
jgi:hypothetical protein